MESRGRGDRAEWFARRRWKKTGTEERNVIFSLKEEIIREDGALEAEQPSGAGQKGAGSDPRKLGGGSRKGGQLVVAETAAGSGEEQMVVAKGRRK